MRFDGKVKAEAKVGDLDSLEALEQELLLEGLFRRYGLDFREYSGPSLRRRIAVAREREGVATTAALLDALLHDPEATDRFLRTLAIHVTSMFRDPEFYLAFRRKVVPLLRTYPFLRVWVAGCSSGEEVYSMAILLQEEGLYDRARIYATDLSDAVVEKAAEGIFPLQAMQSYTQNYHRAGGENDFSGYYRAQHGSARMRSDLSRNLTFAQHNLTTDVSFNEFHVILCRNVMIYFRKGLQSRVLELFHCSLLHFGYLGLGKKESLYGFPHEACYSEVESGARLFKRVS